MAKYTEHTKAEYIAALRELADFLERHDLEPIGTPQVQVQPTMLELFLGEDPTRFGDTRHPFRMFGPARLVTVCSPMEWARTLHPQRVAS